MKLFYSKVLIFCLISFFLTEKPKPQFDPKQFPKGHPLPSESALTQLRRYPLPRYLPGHHLERLFNWMDPMYLGGGGQPQVTGDMSIANAEKLQDELVHHWQYGIVISNIQHPLAFAGCPPFVGLANANPDIPLHVISNWLMIRSNVPGRTNPHAYISTPDMNPAWYSTMTLYGRTITQAKFNFPDSLIRLDGEAQKYYIAANLKWLKRPINIINENGEEAPGPYLLPVIKNDPSMIRMKDSMKIASWEDFMAIRKMQMRNTYSSCFMKSLPELKNTRFTCYTVEGGPVDRFEWHYLKKCQSKINGNYYSTPDFYPRWPFNWKDWKGPWHGWKWIEEGRTVEIKDGDHLFSPFVAAGWSKDAEEDIRPGQWLGLLKCLAVIGAEYYYVGYFNLSAPFTEPSNYVWQAAMPAYAQAVTSRYEDVLRDGNVLFEDGAPKISWKTTDTHVLLTVRKHNKKEKYVICGTYQPFSNDMNEIPEKTDATIALGGEKLSFEIRRQGSVYIYEKTSDGKILFYQLDGWHENAHPDYWSSDFLFEAELADIPLSNSELFTISTKGSSDFRNSITYVKMEKNKEYRYGYEERDSVPSKKFLWIRYKGAGTLSVALSGKTGNSPKQSNSLPNAASWKWIKLDLPLGNAGVKGLAVTSLNGELELDKLVVSDRATAGSW